MKNLEFNSYSKGIFCVFISLLFFSVSYFSGASLESQLSLSGGEGFILPSSIVVLLFFFISLLLFFQMKNANLKFGNILLSSFAVIMIYKFSLLLLEGEDIAFALKASIFLFMNLFVFIVFYHIIGDSVYLKLVSKTFCIFSILSAFVGIWMLFFGSFKLAFIDLTQFSGYPRLYSWYGNPNIMATSIGLALLTCSFSILKVSKFVIFFLIMALALTGSKGVISALLITSIITFLSHFLLSKQKKSIGKKNIFLILLFSILLFFVAIKFSDFIFSTLLRLDASDLSSASGRVDIWKDALSVMNLLDESKLIFGVGYGSFSSDFGKSAHSYYIKTIYEDGFLFIFLFMLFLIFSLVKSLINYRLSGDRFYLFYVSMVLFLMLRGVSSPTFFQDKIESYIFIIFLVPMFFKREGTLT